jgi:hypothetical protein
MSNDPVSLSLEAKVELFVGDVFGGVHRVRKLVCEQNHYMCVPHGTLSTFDDDKLTRIVIASHRYALRAEVDAYGMRGVKILLHNRNQRDGRMWQRHPSLAQVFGPLLAAEVTHE